MGEDALHIAVDLGAGSGRVFLVRFGEEELRLDEVRRFHYPPVESEGHLRWDLLRIFDEIKAGIHAAASRARHSHRPISSIGVDSWGVDYGLVDADGQLVELPVCYRDARTRGVMEEVFAQVPRAEIFARTGIQFLPFNTLFQLYAHAREGLPKGARKLLLIPDLINLFLTGRAASEWTNATTTQLVNARTRAWDRELAERLDLPVQLLAEIVPAGTDLGRLKKGLADELGCGDVRIVAPATHDTGSAVVGTPLEEGWAYISSGTWSLVGVELDQPLINDDVARCNLTNEGGAFGTVRFLKNVMGLWIFERCRAEWGGGDYGALLREVSEIDEPVPLIFPDDGRFLNPPSMLEAIRAQLEETGQRAASEPAVVAKTVLDSLALRYASVLRVIERLTGRRISGVRIVGGGSRNDYLNQATANATGLPIIAGPVEATVIGNAAVQAIFAGRFPSLAEARRHVARHCEAREFAPREGWDEARRLYAEVEARYEMANESAAR
ncbi:rhamnulokinase [Pyrinomonas methylaliphatogenes]|uniref:Pentulose/hexulose kinase n=1 Tax=Pyrinomonas methylaliphatogenes TaxID=454194 RepID=A0A0B6WVM5_9BACT|nr:rhamnulokinase family protein [Pyrinomonas methylaliphatogenes]MBX5479188.1 rhamnulokinase [Pyrinomonas methylaliphatogenes]CDM64175.1 pentulose/hexulose kinase [Pyrinomonas methylaliphatogenes]